MKKKDKNKVVKHLKGDIKTFKDEASEDKKLISKLAAPKKKKASSKKKRPMKKKVGNKKFKKVMHEFKEGELHSGSKTGPKVKKLSQARAIAFSEDRIADKTNKGAKKKSKNKK